MSEQKLKAKNKHLKLSNTVKNNRVDSSPRRHVMKIATTRKALLAAIKASTNVDLTKESNKYFHWFDKQMKRRGPKGGLQRCKLVHHTALNFMLRQKDPKNEFLSTDKDGFPKCIKYLKKYTTHPPGIQAVNSLLAYYRAVKLPADPDFSTITETGKPVSKILINELLECIPNNWKFDPSALRAPKPLFRSKRGPNGHATLSAALDLLAINKDKTLSENLQNYLEEANGLDLMDLMEDLTESLKESGKSYHSEIALKREGGGKTRPFAIVDFWSQSALKPLHDKIFSILKGIQEDCTFNQDFGIPKVKSWTTYSEEIYCFDLKSATDRWPLEYQKDMLGRMSNSPEFAAAWAAVMSQRNFRYKRKTYRWQQGQPLGALSSWGVFSLSHHLAVRAAYQRVLRDYPYDLADYFIIGDDIIIRGQRLAEAYLEIVTALGVTIQKVKTITGSAAEFCKRHFIDGTEVSPLPINLIAATVHSPLLINMLIESVISRSSITNPSAGSLDSLISCFARTEQEKDKLRLIASNPITGQKFLDANRSWVIEGNLRIKQEEYETLYAITKYKYLVSQYSQLQRGQEKFESELKKVVLPGILPDHPADIHPFVTSLIAKYRGAKATSHKSLGKYWSERELNRNVLPIIPRLSFKMLSPKMKIQAKHSAKVISEFHKKVKTLIKLTKSHQPPKNLVVQGLLGKRALSRNHKRSLINSIGRQSLKSTNNSLSGQNRATRSGPI